MAGIAIKMGIRFTVVPRNEIRARKVRIHKTGQVVFYDGEVKPLWENDCWDLDHVIWELAEKFGVERLISDWIVDSEERLEFLMQGGVQCV